MTADPLTTRIAVAIHGATPPNPDAALALHQAQAERVLPVVEAEVARLRKRIHEAVDECQRRHAPYVKRCARFDMLARLAAHYWPEPPADGLADSDEKRPFGWESQVTQARVVQAMEAAVRAALASAEEPGA